MLQIRTVPFLRRICLALLAVLPAAAPAQSRVDAAADNAVVLKQGTLYLPDNAAAWLDSFQSHAPAGPAQVLVRFAALPGAEARAQLESAGLQLMEFMGNGVFTAILRTGGLQPQTLQQQGIRSFAPVAPAWKIEPAMAVPGTGKMTVLASWYEGVDVAALEAHIAACGGAVADRSLWTFRAAAVTVPADQLTRLADWYGIRYLGQVARDTALNIESANAGKVNMAAVAAAYGGPGLDGTGVTVGVGDNFSGIAHIDLSDRIINFNPWPYQNHGVHINGIVGGAGIMDPKGRGMAPGVILVDHLYSQVWQQTVAMKQAYGMTLTNNSYAAMAGNCSYAGTYDLYSEALDRLSRTENTVQHVFAAGNDGGNTCGAYPQGFATVVGSYQAAKNVIVVANNTKRYENFSASARGPVRDGRLKPEISAVGTDVYSTTRNDGYLSAGGTSMASPGVTGALALLSQRYKQLHGADPRGDVLKALILNGATDMGNPGPDFSFGFGVLNLYRSLELLTHDRYAVRAAAHQDRQSMQITVPANTAQLKVMLYWHDVPASPAAALALVNDLDLTVTAPSGTVHLPLVLDPAPAGVTLPAAPGADHINNIEQVVVSNPPAGTYNVTVTGYQVPFGPQDYVIAWDVLPEGVQLTFPAAGASWPANDSMRIYWDASADTHTLKLEFSADNGGTWTTIADNIPADRRYYTWYTPNISAPQCRLRLGRNGTAQQNVSAPFVINPQPVVQLSATQCPGYMAVSWDAVPNATAYEILQKWGTDLRAVDTVAATSYTFSGLATNLFYYAAVRPLIQGAPGWRSLAVKRRPDDGDCAGSISDGDLMAERIISPGSGRMYTSTQLSAGETLTLAIRNADDVPVNHFRIAYRVNNGAWQSQEFHTLLPENSVMPVSVSGIDLSAAGSYSITAAVQNLAASDPVAVNDTIRSVIRQLRNDTVSLLAGFTETFESAGTESVSADAMGVTPDGHWDFSKDTDTGRLRFAVSPEIVIQGSRSASLDAWTQVSDNTNYLDGTFNLAIYDTLADEVRLEFSYKLHGMPKFSSGNQVWVRGSDQQPWTELYAYDTLRDAGTIIHSGSLSLTDALRLRGQDFSTSFQVRFGQHDTSVIAANDYGNGLTLDDVKLYTVMNDVQLVRIAAPAPAGCGLGGSEALSIVVRNGYNQPQYNVALFYRLDSGVTQTATLPVIAPKDTVLFTFPQPADLSAYGAHTLDVWLAAAGDTYTANDSISGFIIRNQPLITTFPYLEQFEQHDGYWYAGGKNSSWAYGTPAGVKISRAASGTKAWKTSLDGYYNNSEASYLYSPCFDLASLRDPMLSFSLALDVEHCEGEPCDAAFVEYSVNGGDWQRLGAAGQGTNWYNADRDVWSVQDFTRWHVASIPLPAADNVRLRFALITDSGVTLEGVAVDDIHIFDRAHAVYEGKSTGTITADLSSGTWNDFTADGKWLAQINPGTQETGGAGVTLYRHRSFFHEPSSQYFFPVNFVLSSPQTYADSASVRLFVTDSDVVTMISDTTCVTCSLPEDAYSLGITQYTDANKFFENGSLDDNRSGQYTYYPAQKISWVPYDNGYYAGLKLLRFSELWFNDGGPLGAFPLTEPAVALYADKISDLHAGLRWLAKADTATVQYELERSYDSTTFSVISMVPARREQDALYLYTDTPAVAAGAPVYYRVRYRMDNGRVYFSATKRLDWTLPNQLFQIYPNPARSGYVAIAWSSMPAGSMEVSVSDLMGRQVYRQGFAAGAWNNVTMIRVPGLASGMYMVRVMIGGNLFERKLVVQ